MHKRLFLRFLLVLFLGLTLQEAIPSAVWAQAPAQQNHAFDQSIAEINAQIKSWERSANIQIGLAITLFVCGLATSAVHRLTGSKGKTAVLALGLVTSVLTYINSGDKVFQADYRQLRQAAADARLVRVQMDRIATTAGLPSLSPNDSASLIVQFTEQMNRYSDIVAKVSGPKSTEKAQLLLQLPTVYAQGSPAPPAWMAHPPVDSHNLYFVGRSTAHSMNEAKDQSLGEATAQVAQHFQLEPPYTPTDGWKNVVKNAATVQDTYFHYDEKAAQFTFYTLVRISRDLRNALPSQYTLKRADWHPIDLAYDAQGGLFALDRLGEVDRLKVSGGTVQAETLFHLPAGLKATAIAATADTVLVSSNGVGGCTLYHYSLTTKKPAGDFLGQSPCQGVASDGRGVFLAMPKTSEIRYWPEWGKPAYKSLSAPAPADAMPYVVLQFDRYWSRLILSGGSGRSFALTLGTGKWAELDQNVGYVHAIAAAQDHIFYASGRRVLSYNRNNQGENPPRGLEGGQGGPLYGIAVDSSNAVWIADHDNGTVKGPFPID